MNIAPSRLLTACGQKASLNIALVGQIQSAYGPPAVELASQVPQDAEEHVVRCERDQLLRVHVRGGAEDPATLAAASLEDPNFST